MHKLLTPILTTDSYKASHYLQYPPGAQYVSSYIEARGGAPESVFFGLQAFVREYLNTPIKYGDVTQAQKLFEAHGVPFNREGWMRIVNVHNGYLPIRIDAVPEGTVMPTGNVQVQVVNTDPELPWLTSYIETALLRAIWYPSTVATNSREVKKVIYAGLVETSDNPDQELPFKLHDFGGRGATCSEAAMLGGMGHLLNFQGTDTVEALVGAMAYYDADGPVGFSIPASEHSTMTSWGRDGEVAAFKNMLANFRTGLVACVSDSYDLMHAVRNIWGGELRDLIMMREGTLVVRPDSGDPVKTPLDVIEILMERFGYDVNSKGYKVLPPQVRVIQGDGMNLETVTALIDEAIARGISVDNFAMGMGGGLLQKLDRDTLKYAMKANAIKIGDEWRDVYKDPITDRGKRSKRGRLALVKRDGVFTTVRQEDMIAGAHGKERNYLRTVYDGGRFFDTETFETIRERCAL